MQLTQRDLHKIKVGDVIYHINPYHCKHGIDVKIVKIEVSSITYTGSWFWKKADKISFMNERYGRVTSQYVSDMFTLNRKFTTSCSIEATEYLYLVHAGAYDSDVLLYHTLIFRKP